ncbi:hypothetical protein RJ640_015372 [Escallonia rubra]|uniref:Uncharacterized protein n=1 Tax=Escallonia rubra TaxID=112253 RepID=A0AA88QP53_9ASTE|nr:hypothetical protein RJ640_015372 [Escallonia rubra]
MPATSGHTAVAPSMPESSTVPIISSSPSITQAVVEATDILTARQTSAPKPVVDDINHKFLQLQSAISAFSCPSSTSTSTSSVDSATILSVFKSLLSYRLPDILANEDAVVKMNEPIDTLADNTSALNSIQSSMGIKSDVQVVDQDIDALNVQVQEKHQISMQISKEIDEIKVQRKELEAKMNALNQKEQSLLERQNNIYQEAVNLAATMEEPIRKRAKIQSQLAFVDQIMSRAESQWGEIQYGGAGDGERKIMISYEYRIGKHYHFLEVNEILLHEQLVLGKTKHTNSAALPKFLYHQHNLNRIELYHVNFNGKILLLLIEKNTELQLLLLPINAFTPTAAINPISTTSLKTLASVSLVLKSQVSSANCFKGGIPSSFGGMASLSNYIIHIIESRSTYKGHNKINPLAYRGKILDIFSVIDLSCNKFTGLMPLVIGNIVDTKSPKLSHDCLRGIIPTTFSNLKGIGSMDLSFNKLSGGSPSQLANTDGLGSFNLSFNNLSGMIPQANHIQTSDEISKRKSASL